MLIVKKGLNLIFRFINNETTNKSLNASLENENIFHILIFLNRPCRFVKHGITGTQLVRDITFIRSSYFQELSDRYLEGPVEKLPQRFKGWKPCTSSPQYFPVASFAGGQPHRTQLTFSHIPEYQREQIGEIFRSASVKVRTCQKLLLGDGVV